MAWGSWVLKVSILLGCHKESLTATTQTTGAAGFRFDAIKHMDRRFLLSFVRNICSMQLISG